MCHKQKKNSKEVINDLNLIDTNEWGYLNGNSERVEEFIDYLKNNSLEDSVVFNFIDLICSSMNEALIKNNAGDKLINMFKEYVYNIDKTEVNSMILGNWASYESTDVDPFPVSKIICEILKNC